MWSWKTNPNKHANSKGKTPGIILIWSADDYLMKSDAWQSI